MEEQLRHTTEALLRKYMDGTTTAAEEQQLRHTMQNEAIPAKWETYRLMLAGKPRTLPADDILEEDLTEEFDTICRNRNTARRRTLLLRWTAAAAIVAVALTVGWNAFHRPKEHPAPAIADSNTARTAPKQDQPAPAEHTTAAPAEPTPRPGIPAQPLAATARATARTTARITPEAAPAVPAASSDDEDDAPMEYGEDVNALLAERLDGVDRQIAQMRELMTENGDIPDYVYAEP